MTDRGSARDVNEAARRFAETVADSYRLVYGQAAESQERQQRRAREFSELVANNLREQAESSRSSAQQLSDQVSKQQEAGQALARESVEAYAEFLDNAFAQYRANTERAVGRVQEGATATGRTATGLVGAATDATTSTLGAATESAGQAAETATFPIPGYDEMNVEEILERLDTLTDDQVRRLRDYERENQNRKTLMERFESRLKTS